MDTPFATPKPFAPVWSNEPTFRDARAEFLLWSCLMAVLGGSGVMMGITEVALQPWAASTIFFVCVGPVALFLTYRGSKQERAMRAAVAAVGRARIEQRCLALVATAAPSWTESVESKEPLDVTVWWETCRHGVVATEIEVYSPARKKIRRVSTDDESLYGLRLVSWPPLGGDATPRRDRGNDGPHVPHKMAFRLHLPPLTAHQRMALAAAAAPGLAEHRAEIAAHESPDAGL